MKKTRGKKKKVSHPKKVNNFFIFKNKVAPLVLAFVFLALVILLPFFTTGNAVNSSITGKASFLDNPVSINFPNALSWLEIGGSWREIIVYIIVLAIIFVMLLDILTLISIFSNWVSLVIAIGFSIIAALTNIIRQISMWVITLSAGAGIAAGFIEIIVSIVIFVGLVFGSSRIAIWAAKRKAQREEIRAIKGAGQAGAAITGLKAIQRDFRK